MVSLCKLFPPHNPRYITLQFGVKIVAGRDGAAMLPISLSWLGPDQLVQLAAALGQTEHAQ